LVLAAQLVQTGLIAYFLPLIALVEVHPPLQVGLEVGELALQHLALVGLEIHRLRRHLKGIMVEMVLVLRQPCALVAVAVAQVRQGISEAPQALTAGGETELLSLLVNTQQLL
jgi:hypothetical protein